MSAKPPLRALTSTVKFIKNAYYSYHITMNHQPIVPAQITLAQIESVAESVAAEFGFSHPEGDIREFVSQLGGVIEVLTVPNFEQLESGSIEVRENGDFKIYLSPLTSPVRDTFTIGHELGHLFLHSGKPWGSHPLSVGRFPGKDENEIRCEQQANRFAAAILMPADAFRNLAGKTGNDLGELSAHFRVSIPAVQARLRSLQLEIGSEK